MIFLKFNMTVVQMYFLETKLRRIKSNPVSDRRYMKGIYMVAKPSSTLGVLIFAGTNFREFLFL